MVKVFIDQKTLSFTQFYHNNTRASCLKSLSQSSLSLTSVLALDSLIMGNTGLQFQDPFLSANVCIERQGDHFKGQLNDIC